MILDFFPENVLGDGPKSSRIRVKSSNNVENILFMTTKVPFMAFNKCQSWPLNPFFMKVLPSTSVITVF